MRWDIEQTAADEHAIEVPVAGYVEHNGARIDDPYFAQGWTVEKPIKKASPALRLAAICKALNEGEIDAALLMAKSA